MFRLSFIIEIFNGLQGGFDFVAKERGIPPPAPFQIILETIRRATDDLKNQFMLNYSNSAYPRLYLDNEIEDLKSLLLTDSFKIDGYINPPAGWFITKNNQTIQLLPDELVKIRKYIYEYMVKGSTKPSAINLRAEGFEIEVFAVVLHEYYESLLILKKEETEKPGRIRYLASKAEIDKKFSEMIPKEKATENDILLFELPNFKEYRIIDGIEYVHRRINTRDEAELRDHAYKLFFKYEKEHPDRTIELFKQKEIKWSEELSSIFSDYLNNDEHLAYHSILERWINFLQSDFRKPLTKDELFEQLLEEQKEKAPEEHRKRITSTTVGSGTTILLSEQPPLKGSEPFSLSPKTFDEFIEIDDKILRTNKELQQWYNTKLKERKNKDNITEKDFLDQETQIFRKELQKRGLPIEAGKSFYWELLHFVNFLNKKLEINTPQEPKDYYSQYVKNFEKKMEVISIPEERRNFIQDEIDERKKSLTELRSATADIINNPIHKKMYQAGERYLIYLQGEWKTINEQQPQKDSQSSGSLPPKLSKDATEFYKKHGAPTMATVSQVMEFLQTGTAKPLKEKPNQPGKNKRLLTYHWKKDDFTQRNTLLKKLYDEIRGKLIEKSTSYQSFKAIFSNSPVDKITKPVRWHDNTASEALYFIWQLQEKEYTKKENTMKYERFKKCFVKNDGSLFEENLKELYQGLKQNIAGSLSAEKRKHIDDVLKYLAD